ncbi:MAG: hypothetical protein L6Q69_10255 [Zoogloea sp.]|jgi:hypothetical protein|nr:hypothetical protein [Zoogloea sp.]
MLPTPLLPISPASSSLPVIELMGRVWLAQVDLAQRMQFLASRLSIGLLESHARRHIQRVDETFYAADLAEVEERTALLMEAGSEGMVTIMRTYIEELTQAQICCVAASFRRVMSDEAAAQLLSFTPPGHVPSARRVRRPLRVSAGG